MNVFIDEDDQMYRENILQSSFWVFQLISTIPASHIAYCFRMTYPFCRVLDN